MELKSSTNSYNAYGYYTLHFADGTSYSSGTYNTYYTGWTIMTDESLPIHEGLAGMISRIEVFVRSQYHSPNSYAYVLLTVNGHETSP